MKEAESGELLERLAQEFQRRGWEYDLQVGREIVNGVEAVGYVYGTGLAERVPSVFLHKNGVSRRDLGDAIERALGGCVPVSRSGQSEGHVIDNRQYRLDIHEGAQVMENNIAVGGEVNIRANGDSSKDELLQAIYRFVGSFLAGEWDESSMKLLQEAVNRRSDIEGSDVSDMTLAAGKEAGIEGSKIQETLERVSTIGIGGALGAGISEGLWELYRLMG